MKNKTTLLLIFGLLTLSLFSCKKDEQSPLVIPDSYDASTFDANTVTEYQIRNQLKALVDEMKTGRVEGVTVSATSLNNLYNAGTTSLSSITIASFNARMDFFFEELAKASGGTFDPTLPVSGEGGVLGGYLFEENGAELEQLVEKGLFGAALYHHVATDVFTGEITQAKLDRALALYGANPTFPNSSNGSLHSKPDVYSAVYAARRDDNSGTGFYRTIQKSFITAQAAIAAGSDYDAEKNAAIEAILFNWEKALMATVINYSYSAIDKLSLTNPTGNDYGSALHALGEGVGFALGLSGTARKQISDTKIAQILTKLRYPNDSNITMHEFVKNPVQAAADLQDVISIIKDEYNFSNADLDGFKKNWINEQNR
jgi:hypothetical protein